MCHDALLVAAFATAALDRVEVYRKFEYIVFSSTIFFITDGCQLPTDVINITNEGVIVQENLFQGRYAPEFGRNFSSEKIVFHFELSEGSEKANGRWDLARKLIPTISFTPQD